MSDAGGGGETFTRRDLQDRAIQGASWTMIHTVTGVPIAFVVNILLARTLGVAHYGRLAFLMTLMDVVGGVVALGVTTGTIQFGAKAHAAGRRDDVRALLSRAQGFRILVAAPLLTVVVLLVAHVPVSLLVLAIVFGVWIPGLFDGAATCLGIENKTASGAKIAMVANLAVQAATVLSVVISQRADVVWATRLIVGALGVVLALAVVDAQYRAAVIRPRLPVGMPQGFWQFAIPTAIGGVLATLVLSRTEVFVLSWLGDAASVGTFALAFGLASHVFAPAQALVGPLVPAISGLREIDAPAVREAFERTTRTAALLVGGLCVVVAPALALLIPLIYGSAYTTSSPMFAALVVSAALLVAAAPVSAFVMSRLAARSILMFSSIALLIDIAVAIALIPIFGGWGAVIANISGALSQLLMLVNSELRASRTSWQRMLHLQRPLFLAVVVGGLAWFGADHTPLPTVVDAVLASALGLVLWVLAIRGSHSGLTDGDAVALERALPGSARKLAGRLVRILVTTGVP